VLKDKLGSAAGVGVNGLVWSRSDNTLYYTVNLPTRVGGLRLGPGPVVKDEVTVAKFPLGGLDDLMLDNAGNFYVCMWLNGKVMKISPDGKKDILLDKLDGPSAVEFAPGTGDLYVLIKGGNTEFKGTRIIKINSDAAAYKLPFLP
jgi:sugar lactone lactonase YvrE